MAFVPEDGTGLSTANSLATLAFATDYWASRSPSTAWLSGGTAKQQLWLVQATDYVERRYRFDGIKKTYLQALSFPRTDLAERDGQLVPDNVVPPRVSAAVAFLGNTIANGWDPNPILDHGGRIKSESLGAGALSTTYMDSALIEDAIAYVDGLLFPFLSASGVADTTAAGRMTYPDRNLGFSAQPEVPDAFATGRFDA